MLINPGVGQAFGAGVLARPIVVFDMAFHQTGDTRPKHTVTNAASSLSAALRRERAATPYFLSRPLLGNGNRRIRFPKEMRAQERPLIFALSLYDHMFKEVQRETEIIKDLYPGARIMMGGPSVNTTENLLGLAPFFPHVDALVKGDGEAVVSEVVRALMNGGVGDGGISDTLRGVFIRTDGFQYLDNRVGVLDPDGFDAQGGVKAYPALIEDMKRWKALVLSTSRGCRYHCVFCSHQYHPRRVQWSAQRTVEELRRIKGMIERGVLPKEAQRISFQDDDFFQDRRRAMEFLDLVAGDPALRNFFRFSFTSSVRSLVKRGRADAKLLDAIGRVKTRVIFIGTDGFHPSTLRALKGNHYTFEDAGLLIRELDDRGIHQFHNVILTYPGITKVELGETLYNMSELLIDYGGTLKLDIANISPIAYESNGLMKDIRTNARPKVIRSDRGDRKMLPVQCGLVDKELQNWLARVLRKPFFNGKRARRFLRQMGRVDPDAKYFLKLRKRFLPPEVDIHGVLRQRSGRALLQIIALSEMLEDFKREFPQEKID